MTRDLAALDAALRQREAKLQPAGDESPRRRWVYRPYARDLPGPPRSFWGYAVLWDRLSVPMPPDGWRERIARGAFAAYLASGADVGLVWQHRLTYGVLAR